MNMFYKLSVNAIFGFILGVSIISIPYVIIPILYLIGCFVFIILVFDYIENKYEEKSLLVKIVVSSLIGSLVLPLHPYVGLVLYSLIGFVTISVIINSFIGRFNHEN